MTPRRITQSILMACAWLAFASAMLLLATPQTAPWAGVFFALTLTLTWADGWHHRRTRRQQAVAAADAERRILTDAALIVLAEAARIRAEQQTMPGLDMEDRWDG